MRPFLALLILASPHFFSNFLSAQPENLRNDNAVFDDQIRTVQLRLAGASLTLPVVDVKAADGSMFLEFDHLGTDIKDYVYTLIHCNSDWQPSELDNHEYIQGYTEDRITEYANSFNTLTQYTHYTLSLPNENVRWTQSGNYLLQVFDGDDDKRLVLVRRFMVVEPVWRVEAEFTRPAIARKFDTHHEIDFIVRHKNMRIANPQQDVKAFVLQNGRWDNAIGPLKPYITREEQLVFDYQDRVAFPAGKEWRLFDMRTFDYRGEHVARIYEQPQAYEVVLRTDKSRAGTVYLYQADINGRFSIENSNSGQSRLQCDYATVMFSLAQNQAFEDEDVYVFGELTDWQLKPEFKMEYSAEHELYTVSAFLKQGYYNYQYVLVNRTTGAMDPEGLEGNWHEAGNIYSVLVYYRPFGARFDRLLTPAVSIDSRNK